MTIIEILDKAAKNGTRFKDIDINPTFEAAYFYSIDAENELINFAEVIWDYDIDPILENCQRLGISEFTISSTFSGLIETIAELQKRGCTLDGLTEINSRYSDWKTGKKQRIPAFKMSIGK
jgi:hypothetical protein